MTPDVNVLVAASRSDHPHHKVAYSVLTRAVSAGANGATIRLMPMVLASYLRLVTNPRIFPQPTPVNTAVGFIDALITIPGVEIPALGPEWPIFRQLCLEGLLTANTIPDAWLAAAVTQLGEHLVTFDAGFRRLLQRSSVTVLAAT